MEAHVFILKRLTDTEVFCLSLGQNNISKALVGAHEGGIFSLCVMKDGSVLSGGGKDRRIIHWSNAYQKTGQETEVNILSSHGIPT